MLLIEPKAVALAEVVAEVISVSLLKLMRPLRMRIGINKNRIDLPRSSLLDKAQDACAVAFAVLLEDFSIADFQVLPILPIRLRHSDPELFQRMKPRIGHGRLRAVEPPASLQSPKLREVSLVLLDDFIEQFDGRYALGHPGGMDAAGSRKIPSLAVINARPKKYPAFW